jgi:adenylate cyclase
VTEARNAAGEFFGRERLTRRLAAIGASASTATVAATLRDEVQRFTAGSEPADDLAILILRWQGPRALSGP